MHQSETVQRIRKDDEFNGDYECIAARSDKKRTPEFLRE